MIGIVLQNNLLYHSGLDWSNVSSKLFLTRTVIVVSFIMLANPEKNVYALVYGLWGSMENKFEICLAVENINYPKIVFNQIIN